MVLTRIPGVSERMANKMTAHFGSEDAVVSTLASGDVARLAEVEGLSAKRALSLARQYAGDGGRFLATKEAKKIHQQLLTRLQSFAACSATKERMGLLMPMTDPTPRRRAIRAAMELDEAWLNQQAKTWQRINRLKEKQERYERVIVSPEPLDHLENSAVFSSQEPMRLGRITRSSRPYRGSEAAPQWKHGWVVAARQFSRPLAPGAKHHRLVRSQQNNLDVLCDLVESNHRGEHDNAAATLGSIESAGRPSRSHVHARGYIPNRGGREVEGNGPW